MFAETEAKVAIGKVGSKTNQAKLNWFLQRCWFVWQRQNARNFDYPARRLSRSYLPSSNLLQPLMRAELIVQPIAAPHPLASLAKHPSKNQQFVVSLNERRNDSTSPVL